MKYFVTGATGFVGGRVARRLVEAAKAKDLADLGIAVHQGDITDKESIRKPITGVDGVFHIAGWYKVGVKDKSEGEKIKAHDVKQGGGRSKASKEGNKGLPRARTL